MTIRTQSQDHLPPVAVDCGWCSTQFLSRARHRVSVHCPRCGHSVRVRRPGDAQPPGTPELAKEPAALLASPAAGRPGGENEDDEDDEDNGLTYVTDDRGHLVLADWTADGRLIPAVRPAARYIPAPLTWPEALAALGWQLDPAGAGCQVRTPEGTCGADATRRISGGWACGPHHSALCTVINGQATAKR